MRWFVISRTASLVWEEWARREKKKKVFRVFWSAVIVYLLGLAGMYLYRSPFDGVAISDLTAFVPKAQCVALALFAGPFAFAGACAAVYFLANVFWCLAFPLAGIQYLLSEEEKASGRMMIFNGKDGK